MSNTVLTADIIAAEAIGILENNCVMGDLVYHPAGAKADIRNATLRAKSPDDLYRDLEWLYAGPPAWSDAETKQGS